MADKKTTFLNLLDHLNPVPALKPSTARDDIFPQSKFSEHSPLSGAPSASATQQFGEKFLQAVVEARKLSVNDNFELFNPVHMNYAERFMNELFDMEFNKLGPAMNHAKLYLNKQLFYYVVSVVLRHREDAISQNLQIPSHITTSPQQYVNMEKILKQFYQTRFVDHDAQRQVTSTVRLDFTTSDSDPEQFVSYFREDLGIHLHHRHWHEVYPFAGKKEIVNKDRRGELFYYMHQQIVARFCFRMPSNVERLSRYNFERLSNGLGRVQAFNNFREPIKEAYFPKLDFSSNTNLWSPRQALSPIFDLNRDNYHCSVADLERWRERIIEAIDNGCAYAKNEKGEVPFKQLQEPDAINDLGNTIEAVSALSYNKEYYGNMHNMGHMFISYCHDPDKRFKEKGSVMSQSETALRDPMFYRWHAFIDQLFQRYKHKLPPYEAAEKEFKGVSIQSMNVEIGDGQGNPKRMPQGPTPDNVNVFKTFWQTDIIDISDSVLDRKNEKDGGVLVEFTHLQHEEFVYRIDVKNEEEAVTGTVRIFIAPMEDEGKVKMHFNRLRRMFVELDKFTYTFMPGSNTILRSSKCSSVTIPFEQTFMNTADAKTFTLDENKRSSLSYCGCGWPHHLLIGKGNETGLKCYLFVMITDYEKDKVTESLMKTSSCDSNSISYCGTRNKKYPDKRPMGFPFDRNIANVNGYLNDFMTKSHSSEGKNAELFLNMKAIDVVVKFENRRKDGPTVEKYNLR